MATKLIWLALAGALGTLARHGLNNLVPRWLGEQFPWATLIINVAGCFLFGLTCVLAEERQLLTNDLRIIMLTGFMGAFTTYSTYAFDTAQMISVSQWWRAVGNVTLQTLLGISGVFLGFAVGRRI